MYTVEDHYAAILAIHAEARAIPVKDKNGKEVWVDIKYQEAINKHQREIDKLRKEQK